MHEDGTSYQPSNGTEGMIFMENHCFQCIHEKFSHTQCHEDKKCDIMSRTMLHDPGDDEYPEEWIYLDGKPTCTKYQHWDWGGDDPFDDGLNEPPPEPIDDPNQLMFPFMIDEIIETESIGELVPA